MIYDFFKRLHKIQNQRINGIKYYQIILVLNQNNFQIFNSVVSLKIDYPVLVFYFNFLIIFNFDLIY